MQETRGSLWDLQDWGRSPQNCSPGAHCCNRGGWARQGARRPLHQPDRGCRISRHCWQWDWNRQGEDICARPILGGKENFFCTKGSVSSIPVTFWQRPTGREFFSLPKLFSLLERCASVKDLGIVPLHCT